MFDYSLTSKLGIFVNEIFINIGCFNLIVFVSYFLWMAYFCQNVSSIVQVDLFERILFTFVDILNVKQLNVTVLVQKVHDLLHIILGILLAFFVRLIFTLVIVNLAIIFLNILRVIFLDLFEVFEMVVLVTMFGVCDDVNELNTFYLNSKLSLIRVILVAIEIILVNRSG